MDPGMLLQYVVVALAVLASLAYVVHYRMPATARRVRGWIAIRCVDAGPEWLARLGRRLAPAPSAAGSCGSCGGCTPGA